MAVKFVENTKKPEPVTPEWGIDTEIVNDVVYIKARNHEEEWYLFTLKSDGTFYREPSLPEYSGFKLDKEGRIVESKTL